MATYTQNYTLHQWEDSDDFLRTDFNTDFAKIDTAIKGVSDDMTTAIATKSEVVFGTYTGNGASSRTITLGFQPSAVIVEHSSGSGSYFYGGLALPDKPVTNGTATVLAIATTGFTVSFVSYYSNSNTSSSVYYYIAFK